VDEFLTPAQLRALEKVITKARTARGVHRESLSDGEALAFQYAHEVHWAVNGGPHNANIARGTAPLEPQ
jgi:hypothetical protein